MSRPKRTYIIKRQPPTPDSVTKILGNEGFYGDGEPKWDDCIASEMAVLQRLATIKRLRLKRFAEAFPRATDLAERMAQCRPRHRCMSAACPECLRAFQRWFVCNVIKLERSDAG